MPETTQYDFSLPTWTIGMVAAYFNLKTVRTVRRWHTSGRLRGYYISKTALRWRRQDVMTFEQRMVTDSSVN